MNPAISPKDYPTNDAHARASHCAKSFANSSRLPKLDLNTFNDSAADIAPRRSQESFGSNEC
jgi:hypothetical protein